MSGLLDIVTGALEGIDVDAIVGGEAGNLAGIASTVSQLTQGQPLDLGSFVESIAEMDLPVFDFADDLIGQVGQVRDVIPTDIGDVLGPVMQALGNVEGSLGEGVTDIIAPLVNAFKAIEILIHTDFSFGPSAEQGDGEGGGEGGGDGEASGESATTVSVISSNSDSQISPAKLTAFGNVMDELPETPSIGNLLQWFTTSIRFGRSGVMATAVRSIPYLDDIRDPVDTVLAWQSLAAGDLQAQLLATLETLAEAISAQTSTWLTNQLQSLNTIVTTLDLNQLRLMVLGLNTKLDELKTLIDTDALTDPLLTGIENDIAALIVQRDTLAQTFLDDVKSTLDAQLTIMADIPAVLEENMSALLMLLQPPVRVNSPGGGTNFPTMPEASAFTGLDDFLNQYTEVFENLMAALDIGDITEVFEQPAQVINSAIEEVDEAITMVTLEITGRLNQVKDLISSLNIPGIVDDAELAIEDFTSSLVSTLTDAFTPVREGIESIAQQISTVVGSFDPGSIVTTLEEGIDTLAAELESSEIAEALLVVEKFKSIGERLDQLSFAPVTDTVVGAIDEMSGAVAGLGSNLDEPLSSLLKGALAVLPSDLHPVTDPLIANLGDLVDAGPIALLDVIKEAPQAIVDAINGFNPGELIGDSLSAPFQSLLTELEALEPSMLLEPIADEIENLKNRIKENVSPGQLLDPLVGLHEQILSDLDGFNPSDILAPINDVLAEATAKIAESIPIGDVFDEIEKVINDVERILGVDGVADSIIALIQRMRNYLTPFVDASESISDQIQSWLSDSLAVIDAIDIATLQTGFTALSDAIDSTQAATLQSTYDVGVAAINTALSDVSNSDALRPGALMTALVKSHSGCRTSWAGMDSSVIKTRVDALLISANPTAPNFTHMFSAYGRVISTLADTDQNVRAILLDWDDLFHQAGGVLASYGEVPTTAEQLKQWLIDSLEHRLVGPLQAIFEKLAPTAKLLDAFIGPIVALVSELRDTVSQIVAAPAALVAVGESLEEILDRLQDINLEFIGNSIDDIFDEVKEQFRGLDPRGLKNTINEAFDRLLETIGLDQIVPSDALDQVDTEIDAAIDGLRQLDPQVLITDVIQPKFEESIAPFISALDLTPTIDTLIARLGLIEAELGTEMDRVNTAYQGFKSSVPA